MKPPIGGPTSGPTRPGAEMKFMARTRSLRSTERSTTRRPTGDISAPAMPCSTRQAVNSGNELEKPHRVEDSVNRATAAQNTLRAPKRSAIQPPAGSDHGERLRM